MTALGRCGGSQSVGFRCVASGLLVLPHTKVRGSRSAVKLSDKISHQRKVLSLKITFPYFLFIFIHLYF